MSDQTSNLPQQAEAGLDKGKGKASGGEAAQDVSMGEEEDSSSEEEVDETQETVDEPDEDNMEEIDTSNIISGGRTRGRQIDFAKAAEELPEEEDDEDDDDDFEAPNDDDDKMEE